MTLTYYLASEYGADTVRAKLHRARAAADRPESTLPRHAGGRAMTAAFIPLGRVGDIDDVARAAVFLASDEARGIPGAVLRVDGGIVVQ